MTNNTKHNFAEALAAFEQPTVSDNGSIYAPIDFLEHPHSETIRHALKLAENNGWQDISTAPKDQSDILVVGFDERKALWTAKAIVYWETHENRGFLCHRTHLPVSIQPTHWMPLPAPPAIKEVGDE